MIMAIVYILTNESMPDAIKVGITGNLDRRINILIYLNPEWKEEYNGHLKLIERDK